MRICRATYSWAGRRPYRDAKAPFRGARRPCPGAERPTPRRGAALAATLAVALFVLAGCGGAARPRSPAAGPLTVYASLPRSGISAATATAVAAGARQALADAHGRAGDRPVRLVTLDSARKRGEDAWDPAAVEANARRAVSDASAIAYLGELDLGASAVSVPVTSAAGLLQVSPADGLTTLTRTDPAEPEELPARYYPRGRRNFVRLVPTDADQAAALVAWARASGTRRLAIVRDDRLFGRELADEAAVAARRLGVEVTGIEEARRGATAYADLAHDVAERRPDAALYTGLGDVSGDRVLAALRRALPHADLFGSSALGPGAPAVDMLRTAAPPSAYGPAARRILRRIGRGASAGAPADALLGYGAMRLVLDALDAAGSHAGDRAAVVRAALRPGAGSAIASRLRPAAARAGATFASYRRAGARLRFLGLRGP